MFKWLVQELRVGSPLIAIVSPLEYRLGASGLGIHTLFRILNRYGLVDLFFKDRLRGLRTGKPLSDFHLIIFTLSFELDYPNAIEILLKSGLSPFRMERPFQTVIAGGIAPSANPAPISPFFDAIVIGEAEATLPEMMDRFVPLDPEATIERWEELDFLYIPDRKDMATRAFEMDTDRFESYSAFLDPSVVFGNSFLIEIMRGCPHKCRFCLLSYVSLPPRYRDLFGFIDALRKLPHGVSLGLVASAVSDHPQLLEFLRSVPKNIGYVTVSSLRADRLTHELLEELHSHGMRTLTIAPEAGTERLRNAINKPISDEVILDVVKMAAEIGFPRLKLYFMIGLPGEREEDVIGINLLVDKIRTAFDGGISVTVSGFVPKPHTPFRFVEFTPVRELKRRARLLKFRDVEFHIDAGRQTELQAVFSRGDQELADAILLSAREKIPLRNALKKLRYDIRKYLSDEEYLKNAPFNRINMGVGDRFLEVEFNKFRRGFPTAPCRVGSCLACEVCRKLFQKVPQA